MKVSIIIPVYNVASYIEACLESVFGQTYTDIEVILVDDCGSDNSMEVAIRVIAAVGWQNKVKLIRHAHNRGLSAARNSGIQASTGEYLYFLDSDDTISLDCIASLAAPLEKKKVDFVIGDYKMVGTDKKYPPLLLQEGCIEGNENILSAYTSGKWYMMAVNKLINKRFVLDNQLFFKEGLLHEDELWSFMLACCAQSMYVVQGKTYFYYIRKGSITYCYTKKNYEAILQIVKCCVEFVKKEGLQNNRCLYNYVENMKIRMIEKKIESKNSFSIYSIYKESREYYSCNNLDYRWIFEGRTNRIVKDIHYFLPPILGYCYLYVLMKVYIKLFRK